MLRSSLAALSLAACAVASPPARRADLTGEIRHYIRSNRDGTRPEHVVHFRPGRVDVSVYKWVRRCEQAAYVTARMDPAVWEPARLDAGKVDLDGSQRRIGSISRDPATRTLHLHIDGSDGPLEDTAAVPARVPWFLFDYDLGDLNTYLQETRPEADFAFAWAIFWGDSPDMLTSMGVVRAIHRGVEAREDRAARRFDLKFGPRDGDTGVLWLDPHTGALLEAEASVPNHPGMIDFRLRLDHVEPGGQPAWEALLRGHHADCPSLKNLSPSDR